MAALKTLAFLSLIGFSGSQTSDCSYYSLLEHLNLTASNTLLQNMRPVKNWNTATLIQLDMYLLGILEVDQKVQTVTSHIWLQVIWTNEFLTWNSSDFCGIREITLPRSALWLPDIRIEEDISDSGSVQIGELVAVYSNGLVYTSGRQRLTHTCTLNLMMFPFDTQSCNITFSSLTCRAPTMKLGTLKTDTVFSTISEQMLVAIGEWELKDLKVTQSNSSELYRSKLSYTVTMQRKPSLYIINFIVPLFYFLVLDLTSFFISEARGEKLSFKVTILLSISVLLLILQDMLPSTEKRLPMIASYCLGIFTLVGISVLEAMVVIFLMDLDGYCGLKARSSVDAQADIKLEASYNKDLVEVDEKVHEKSQTMYLANACNLLKIILDEVKAAREEAGRQDKDSQKCGRYRRLAEIGDHTFFVLYSITCVVFMVLMYLAWIEQVISI